MFNRRIINALLPFGAAWFPKAEGFFDNLLEGIAQNQQSVKDDLDLLGKIRDPEHTPVLSDLEKEFGVIPATLSTEAERRSRLKSVKFQRATLATSEVLQTKLRAAGFTDVYVHDNDPAVDPDIFLAQAFNMVCGDLLPGGNNAECGEPEAYCAQVGGELLVNGSLFKNHPKYAVQAGMLHPYDPAAAFDPPCCGDGESFCGEFDGYSSQEEVFPYFVPAESFYWSRVFFVGGAATRDPITGAITDVQIFSVPSQRRAEFRRIILRFKPMASWAALIVSWS
ncbi:MAG TPA: hypothetical protein PKY31_04130 [Spirochaetota bacterium]|nr:hypothetical protein [Spirochaetota bacterium]